MKDFYKKLKDGHDAVSKVGKHFRSIEGHCGKAHEKYEHEHSSYHFADDVFAPDVDWDSSLLLSDIESNLLPAVEVCAADVGIEATLTAAAAPLLGKVGFGAAAVGGMAVCPAESMAGLASVVDADLAACVAAEALAPFASSTVMQSVAKIGAAEVSLAVLEGGALSVPTCGFGYLLSAGRLCRKAQKAAYWVSEHFEKKAKHSEKEEKRKKELADSNRFKEEIARYTKEVEECLTGVKQYAEDARAYDLHCQTEIGYLIWRAYLYAE